MRSSEETKHSIGVVGHVVETLIGKQSRKVAFGVWGFIAGNALIHEAKIGEVTYLKIFFTCAALVGLGTIIDTFFEKLSDKLVDLIGIIVSARTGAALSKIDTTKVETTTEVKADAGTPA